APGAARAQLPDLNACQGDLDRLCADRFGLGDRLRCLLEEHADLSPACSAAIAALEASRTAHRDALDGVCRDDAARLCPDAVGDAAAGCLRDRLEAVSPPCREALDALAP